MQIPPRLPCLASPDHTPPISDSLHLAIPRLPCHPTSSYAEPSCIRSCRACLAGPRLVLPLRPTPNPVVSCLRFLASPCLPCRTRPGLVRPQHTSLRLPCLAGHCTASPIRNATRRACLAYVILTLRHLLGRTFPTPYRQSWEKTGDPHRHRLAHRHVPTDWPRPCG